VACLVCACGVGALAASSASASFPELGRCVKVATAGTGVFVKENCIAVSKKHTGEYEWEPGPGAKPAFKETLSGPQLETTSGEKIGCTAIQLLGEYTGAKSRKITKFIGIGCENVTHHTSCYTNPDTPSKIESENELSSELGPIPGSKSLVPWAGWDFKSASSLMPIVAFFCGEAKGLITFKLEGSVIGRVVKTNLMLSSFGAIYKETEGKQLVTSFIGGEPDVLSLSEMEFGSIETKTHEAGLKSTGEITDEEALEIKAKA
jgi:hypothetical protein